MYVGTAKEFAAHCMLLSVHTHFGVFHKRLAKGESRRVEKALDRSGCLPGREELLSRMVWQCWARSKGELSEQSWPSWRRRLVSARIGMSGCKLTLASSHRGATKWNSQCPRCFAQGLQCNTVDCCPGVRARAGSVVSESCSAWKFLEGPQIGMPRQGHRGAQVLAPTSPTMLLTPRASLELSK